MSEVCRILDQLRRSWDGDSWHGLPLWRILADTTAEMAVFRPTTEVHSIAEIVLHLCTDQEVVWRRLQGESPEPSTFEDWVEVNALGEAAWQNALGELRITFEMLCEAVQDLTDDKLDRPVAGKNYSFYVLLHGVVQHNLFHAGQIALLKKLARKAAGLDR
jgi:uncharacterized damage-inducible protein DinB